MVKKVLITALNWGLGHATRCMPIINGCLERGIDVQLASDGRSLNLLKEEYPNLKCHELPSYQIEYPENGSFVFKMATQLPKIYFSIQKEKKKLAEIINSEDIDLIISDNRFGCYNNEVKSIFISHQLNIHFEKPSSLVARVANYLNKVHIENFDEVWVPDWQSKPNLTGHLSHLKKPLKKPVFFLGPLSRFEPSPLTIGSIEVLAIISGPEPQRSILEKKLKKELLSLGKPSVIIRGVTESAEKVKFDNLLIIDHLCTKDLNDYINRSDIVISRTGYSTVMDLAKLRKRAILIPTPGQTEQEFLAKHLLQSGLFISQQQDKIDLTKGISELKKIEGWTIPEINDDLLNKQLELFGYFMDKEVVNA